VLETLVLGEMVEDLVTVVVLDEEAARHAVMVLRQRRGGSVLGTSSETGALRADSSAR
jgi:hypothetical protein